MPRPTLNPASMSPPKYENNNVTRKIKPTPIAVARPINEILLLSLLPVSAYCILRPLPFISEHPPPLPALYTSLGFSIIACAAVLWLIPKLGPSFVKIGLKGRDLLKDRDEDV